MAELTYLIAVTADGFIAQADGSLDCFNVPGDHIAHLAAEYTETIPQHLKEMLGAEGANRHFDTVLMGRSTYAVGMDEGVTNPYPQMRQVVVSRSLKTSPDAAVEVVHDDVLQRVRQLKQDSKLGVWLCGGGKLAASIVSEIDNLVLKVNPVVLGAGLPLFDREVAPHPLHLTSTQQFESGVTFLHYETLRGSH